MKILAIHIYREMRLRFDSIEADTSEAAAEKAKHMLLEDAADFDECDGETFAALVDVQGDENYEHSRVIDFEAERHRKAAPKFLKAIEQMARLKMDGEDGFIMENDDAVDTLHSIIDMARVLVKEIVTPAKDAAPELPAVQVPAEARTIRIEVRGGVVQEVSDVPPGWTYQIIDYDDLASEGEAASAEEA
jgi:hypothetical protein